MVRGISLVGIGSPEEVLAIRRRFPDAYFELPYNLRSLDGMAEAASGRIASLHSLCPCRDYFPNFASDDDTVVSWSSEEMMKDAMTARQLGATVLVLHPGYLIPSLVPSEKNARLRLMESGELDRFVGISSGSICREDYISRPEYRAAFERMLPNLRELSDRLEKMGIILAVENLNPRAGYMLVHPDEMVEIAERTKLHFALDIGHLHVSAERFGLDFLHSLERILSIRKAHGGRVDYGMLRPRKGVLRILERLSSRIMRLLGLFLDGIGLLLVRRRRIECGLCRFELLLRLPELLARILK